ncbi:hypothetical protein EVAR_42607_1 [Eumeta japonica]|uniref:Uncharacterized protein n=1 Tax=Eumeta variegata TaxID=151549 RepID=A0A4C1XL82_EUMVA|nr:hypothetical protein EVAR_42607_1 [Eumeta japonica]
MSANNSGVSRDNSNDIVSFPQPIISHLWQVSAVEKGLLLRARQSAVEFVITLVGIGEAGGKRTERGEGGSDESDIRAKRHNYRYGTVVPHRPQPQFYLFPLNVMLLL